MKKIFSKKSGFTLVEIVIAFAIFSIMAAMIAQILNLTINKNAENRNYEKWLQDQGRWLATKKQVAEYNKGLDKDGDIELWFTKDGSSEYLFEADDGDQALKIAYQMVSVNGEFLEDGTNTGLKDASGLNYFIGDIEYRTGLDKSETDPDENPDDMDDVAAGGSSQMSRFDTRITGTKGIDQVIVKILSVNDAKDEYTFEVTVHDTGVNTLIKNHSQVSLFFGEDSSGGKIATVTAVNNRDKDKDRVKITKACGVSGVNIHCNEGSWGFNGGSVTFKVKFETPFENIGFGDNGIGDLESGCTYKPYNGYANIFGAYEKAAKSET